MIGMVVKEGKSNKICLTIHDLDLCQLSHVTNWGSTLVNQIHANCRLRRVYFADRLYAEDELPPELKLFLPIQVRREE